MVKEEDTTNQNSVDKEKNDDDSEEEDEDYVPPTGGGDEEDEEEADETANNDTTTTSTLSLERQKAVDDAFDSLFGKQNNNNNNNNNNRSTIKKHTKKNTKSMKKQARILADIFGGKSIAEEILSKQSSIHNTDEDNDNKRKRTFTDMIKPIVQMEKKIFAGQTIQIQTTNKSEVAGTKKKKKSGIDSVLEKFQQPTKINTLMKTSSDWDTFKDKNRLKEDIEEKAQGKNAYLIKQDFLTRVDHRRFEMEKAQRDKERAANQK